MTVYELMQELIQWEPNTEVRVFVSPSIDIGEGGVLESITAVQSDESGNIVTICVGEEDETETSNPDAEYPLADKVYDMTHVSDWDGSENDPDH